MPHDLKPESGTEPTSDAATRRHGGARALLEAHSRLAEAVILSRQHPVSGLLPASTAITVHGDYTHAWVRDNVYSILGVWALAAAWRRSQPARALRYEQAVVALMRGLLSAMLRQSHKVERFKHTQDPLDALHAKYDTARGEPVVGDAEWGHLQLDATALFVLMLAQMSASGLRIVTLAGEQAFVQNLVHYLAKAWRTPDYGIWERGHKRNEGVAELNASSLGLAKAALEAIDGFDPGVGTPVIVVGDDIARARATLQALLPRESESKETDAALLAVVGFPAFAVDDVALAERTRATVLDRLMGQYGCKRFLRDGHQTVVERHDRLYYEPGELHRFEHIECEWPLFFTYLLIDAGLQGDAAAALAWRERLDALMQLRDEQPLLPELYIVPADAVDAERAQPGSQRREPNVNVPLVWAQSLYLVGVLLQEGHIQPGDLDPLERRRLDDRREVLRARVALVAEDELVRARLAAMGVVAQTPAQLLPVRLRQTSQLEAVFSSLGACAPLGLTGRPAERLGSLATSRVYRRADEVSLVLPALFRSSGSHLALDNRLLADTIGAELAGLRRQWCGPGEPIFVVAIGASMLDAPGADELVGGLRALAVDPGVRLGPVAELLDGASSCSVAGLAAWPALPAEAPMAAVEARLPRWEEAATRALSAARVAAIAAERDVPTLLGRLAGCRNPYEQVEIAAALWRRAGPELDTGLGADLRGLVQALHARAARDRRWGVLRRAIGLLGLQDDGLEDAVAEIVARGRRVALGRAYGAGAIVSRPLGQADLHERVRQYGGEDPRGRALIEETVRLLSMLIKDEPTLFDGALTLRPWQSLRLVIGWLAREHDLTPAEAFDHLVDLSPHAIHGRLREVIAREQEMTANLSHWQSLRLAGASEAIADPTWPVAQDAAPEAPAGGWSAWREMTGVFVRLPEDFHRGVWGLLQHCRGLVIGDQFDAANLVDSVLARADTTPGERSFALRVEELLSRIQAPEYRQLTVEALVVLSALARANPGLRIESALVLDVVVGTAVRLGWHEGPEAVSGGERDPARYTEHVAQAWQAFYASPPQRVSRLVAHALRHLLQAPAEAPSEAVAEALDDGPAAPRPQPVDAAA